MKKMLKVFLMLLIPVISHATDLIIENLVGMYKANVPTLFCGLGNLYKFGSLEITYEYDEVVFYYQDFWQELVARFPLDTLKESIAKKGIFEGDGIISEKIVVLEDTVFNPCSQQTWKFQLDFLNNELIAAALLEIHKSYIDEDQRHYIELYNIERM